MHRFLADKWDDTRVRALASAFVAQDGAGLERAFEGKGGPDDVRSSCYYAGMAAPCWDVGRQRKRSLTQQRSQGKQPSLTQPHPTLVQPPHALTNARPHLSRRLSNWLAATALLAVMASFRQLAHQRQPPQLLFRQGATDLTHNVPAQRTRAMPRLNAIAGCCMQVPPHE